MITQNNRKSLKSRLFLAAGAAVMVASLATSASPASASAPDSGIFGRLGPLTTNMVLGQCRQRKPLASVIQATREGSRWYCAGIDLGKRFRFRADLGWACAIGYGPGAYAVPRSGGHDCYR